MVTGRGIVTQTGQECLETMAARLAAERASPADVATWRAVLASARRAADGVKLPVVAELDTELHLWVIEISGIPWQPSMAHADAASAAVRENVDQD